MKKSHARKLAKALRSKKFKQGKNWLKQTEVATDESFYCCLGVACEIFKVPETEPFNGAYFTHYKFSGESSLLTQESMELTTFQDETGRFDPDKVRWPQSIPKNLRNCSSLAELNDEGLSFGRIASFIEMNYKEL